MKPLWKHQEEIIKKAQTSPNLFIACEQGTGKTRTMIEILRRRYAAAGRLLKTVVISPIIVCDNWKKEFCEFSKINPNDIIVLTGTGKQRSAELLRAIGDNFDRPKIVITNYHGILIDSLFSTLLGWRPEILVLDESHKVKNPSSKTAKKMQVLADVAAYRFNLTGTPILNSPMDLWMQYRILDKGATFGTNYFAFRARYFMDKNHARVGKQGYFPKWEPTVKGMHEIQEKVMPTMVRVLKKDCLSLPPLIRQIVHVPLSDEQAKLYKEMKKEYITFIKEKAVTASIAAVKALRMQQIVSGFATVENSHGEPRANVRIESNPRLDALEELLEVITPENKVIVWANFIENYKMIAELCDRMKIKYAQINGGIVNEKRYEEMDRFRTDPECKVMIANQAAGGTGINLIEASYAIYYSKGFSLEQDLQSEARNHRGGSEMHERITRIDLVAKGTIDEIVNEALLQKLDVSDTILSWTDRL